MLHPFRLTTFAAVAATIPLAGHATVTISAAATQNMSCSGGICVPTATDAVLNTRDVQTMLASGNLSIFTTNGAVQANDIAVAAPFIWTTANSLTLDAYRSIIFTGKVRDSGTGGVSLVTNDGGSGGALLFLAGGFLNLSHTYQALTINAKKYKLEQDIEGLAYDIVANPKGAFALASDYDAQPDGIYRTIPIPVSFGGSFNGLGHVISRLEIADVDDQYVGFFFQLYGTVSSIGFKGIVIQGYNGTVGGLTGLAAGGSTVRNSWVSGRVQSNTTIGGLVGLNSGTITDSWSSVRVTGGYAGGLVGQNSGTIDSSFATGTIGNNAGLGGLVGLNFGPIENSYAIGAVKSLNQTSAVGGLVGSTSNSTISSSYSTGYVAAPTGATVGGFNGVNNSGSFANCYWDTTTSQTQTGVGSGDNTGVTGLTTQQLQSALPAGFDPAIWAEDPNINNGFPYLIANPQPPRLLQIW